MKYFEITEPYYALVKADNESSAKEEYNEVVADLEVSDDIFEVPEDYALVRYSQAPGEDGKLIDPKEVLESFKEHKNKVLIIDNNL